MTIPLAEDLAEQVTTFTPSAYPLIFCRSQRANFAMLAELGGVYSSAIPKAACTVARKSLRVVVKYVNGD
jgi:hypothetical protein